jgi:hypothetical protein
MSDVDPDPGEERVGRRAELLPEEQRATSDNPHAQAEVILEESDEREFDREAAPGTVLEHRTSEDVADPPDTPPGGDR